MKEKKNIDRLFQEKFKDFEKNPDDAVWNKIENSLKEKKDDRVLPIWWKMAGVAAALIGLLVLGNLIFTGNPDNENALPLVINSQENDAPVEINSEDINRSTSENEFVNGSDLNEQNPNDSNSETNSSIANSNKDKSDSPQDRTETGKNSGVARNARTNSKNESYQNKINSGVAENVNNAEGLKNTTEIEKRNGITEADKGKNEAQTELNKSINEIGKPSRVAENTKEVESSSEDQLENKLPNQAPNNSELNEKEALTKLAETSEEKDDIEDAVAQAEDIEKEKDDVEKLNRWNVAPNVSPVYFNTLASGSSLDGQFNENSKSGDITISYGINGSYALNEKLKVRVGVNKVNLGYSTNDVIVFNGINSRTREGQLSNVELANTTSDQTYMSSAIISNVVAQPNVLITNPKGSLDQEIGFIEVPVEVEYNILDKKFDVNLIGGFSTFFLDRNEIYTNFLGDRVLLGRATNINETSYSANLGIGVNYNFTKNLDLSLEPTFKYQINTFNNTSGDFQPYFIGVYSGIRFKF